LAGWGRRDGGEEEEATASSSSPDAIKQCGIITSRYDNNF